MTVLDNLLDIAKMLNIKTIVLKPLPDKLIMDEIVKKMREQQYYFEIREEIKDED